jgi:hypothetical protein
LVDISLLIAVSGHSLSWPTLLALADRSRLVMPLQHALGAASARWYAEVPADVLTQVAALRVRPLERAFVRCQSSEFLKVIRTWLTLPGLGLKVAFLKGQLFPDRSYMAWRYGTAPGGSALAAYLSRFRGGMVHIAEQALPGRRARRDAQKKPAGRGAIGRE